MGNWCRNQVETDKTCKISLTNMHVTTITAHRQHRNGLMMPRIIDAAITRADGKPGSSERLSTKAIAMPQNNAVTYDIILRREWDMGSFNSKNRSTESGEPPSYQESTTK